MSVTVRRIEPAGADLSRWYHVYERSHRHDQPDEPMALLDEVRAEALSSDDNLAVLALAEETGTGEAVGVSFTSLPVRDNTHVLDVNYLAVLPERRRANVGTRLVDDVLALAAQYDRRTLIALVVATGEPDQDVAGDRAARSWSFSLASSDQRRVLVMPPDVRRIDAARATVGAHADDYEIVTWAGATPPQYLEDRARIQQRMSTDIPLGELDWAEEAWDGARMRRLEGLVEQSGRLTWSAGALHRASGRLVAATWLQAHPDLPADVTQWDTLVLPEHRGHRLGLAIKLANLEQLERSWPAASRIITGNSVDNGPMIAVNDDLGFVVAGAYREYQRQL